MMPVPATTANSSVQLNTSTTFFKKKSAGKLGVIDFWQAYVMYYRYGVTFFDILFYLLVLSIINHRVFALNQWSYFGAYI